MSYAIYCDCNFYAGTLNVAKPGLMRDPYDYTVIALADRSDADLLVSMLDDCEGRPYPLSHGQYAPPSYEVRESSAQPCTLADAMHALSLQYDFRPDGSRIEIEA